MQIKSTFHILFMLAVGSMTLALTSTACSTVATHLVEASPLPPTATSDSTDAYLPVVTRPPDNTLGGMCQGF